MLDKVIITNVSALRAKYGAKYAQVRTAILNLAAADNVRGITSRLVAIDSAADMKKVHGTAVVNASNQRAVKAAVDAIYTAHSPDYILILGGPDVVPHVDLNNPFSGTEDDDGDETVPSDAPYACRAAWSQNPQDFIGPTRVLGRLPDVVGAAEPSYLLNLLRIAANCKTRDRSSYSGYLAFSAKTWKKSTALSVSNLFGPNSPIHTSPPDGPNWTKTEMAPRIHFINCHGDVATSKFFGEYPKGKFFDAHDSAHLPSRVTEGSVIAAECCYGAQLYDPQAANGKPGICSTYLNEGAYGFFGSSTIAYGPAEGNGQADLICQYFIEGVLKGASLGRAALEARQRFVAQFSHLDPSDLKTAVQFNLLGDPSIQAVKPEPHSFDHSATMAWIRSQNMMHPAARDFRRERLARTGNNLSRSLGAAVRAEVRTPKTVHGMLLRAARESGLKKPSLITYRVKFPGQTGLEDRPEAGARRRERTVHVLLGSGPGDSAQRPRKVAIIATMEGSRVVHIRRIHSR
jgi:hypothetical protein